MKQNNKEGKDVKLFKSENNRLCFGSRTADC